MTTNEHARYQAVADQHPDEVGIVGVSVNDYGTPVSVLRCATCGSVVSLCPMTTPERWGNDCLGENCESYDVERDMDIFFDPLAEQGLIEPGPGR